MSDDEWESAIESQIELGNLVKCRAHFGNITNIKKLENICRTECSTANQTSSYDLEKEEIPIEHVDLFPCSRNQTSLFLKGRIKYTEIKEVKKTTTLDMFGSVGGYLGLFVGVSLTTIIEFAEFGIDYVFGQRRKEGQKDRPITSFKKDDENGRPDVTKDEADSPTESVTMESFCCD